MSVPQGRIARVLADYAAQNSAANYAALRDAALNEAAAGLDEESRASLWEALLTLPSWGREGARGEATAEYSRLAALGPSRLHYKILLDIPRTLKGEAALGAPAVASARVRLLDAFVQWFDACQPSAAAAVAPVEPSPPPLASPSKAAAAAPSTAADILGEDIDDDWDVEEEGEPAEPAPAPVLPSAVNKAGVFPLTPRQPTTPPSAASDAAAAAAGPDTGGYAQGMGSLAATLVCALLPLAAAQQAAAAARSSPKAAGGGGAGDTAASAEAWEPRAFAMLQALAGPHSLASPPAPPPPLWVRGFYEPGNSLVRRGCALADDVLDAADPALRAHLKGGWARTGAAGSACLVVTPAHCAGLFGASAGHADLMFYSRISSLYANRPPMAQVGNGHRTPL